MNPNERCDDNKLKAMLLEELAESELDTLFEHVGVCTHCQQRVEELAGSKEDWENAANALLDSDKDSCNLVHGNAGIESSMRGTVQAVKQLLAPASHPELLGRLDRYEIERLIGVGGMGVVFKGYDSELSRPVAIKVLPPFLQHHGLARQRFAREARAAAAVVHQHVVPIHNVETKRELPYLVMHYVAGESLQSRIDREGALELKEILRIGIQTADGLAAAHEQGLIHRDIKPSNILLENSNVDRALLTDFGLARAIDDVQMTRTGTYLGTPQYMSPEQTQAESLAVTSDLFSFGSVLYIMCTGRPPFSGESPFVVMKQIGESDPPQIRALNEEIPDWLETIIQKLHQKNPEDRFQSAGEIRDLLKSCLNHLQQPTQTPFPQSLIPAPINTRKTPEIPPPRRAIGILPKLLLALSPVVIFLFSLPYLSSVFAGNKNSEFEKQPGLDVIKGDAGTGSAPNATNKNFTTKSESLGFGYSRENNQILFQGTSISESNAKYESFLSEYGIRKHNIPESLADNVESQSFRALSSMYAKDKSQVYLNRSFRDNFLLLKLPEGRPQLVRNRHPTYGQR